MKRLALVCVVVGSLLAACAGVPELPGTASSNVAEPSVAASTPAAGASPAAQSAAASAPAASVPPASASAAASASPEAIGRPDPNAPLTGTVWQWLQTENTTAAATKVTRPSVYTIEFRDDQTIGIRSDCNSAGGTFKMDGATFYIYIGPQTTAACPDGSLSAVFLRELPSINSYVMDNGTLRLAPTTDGGIMSFVPAP